MKGLLLGALALGAPVLGLALTFDSGASGGVAATDSVTMSSLTVTNSAYLATTSGKVGIGTSSPNTSLEVSGGRIRINGAGSSGVLELSNAGQINYIYTDGSTSNLLINSTNGSYHVILQGGGGANGFVGVGTTGSPTTKLHMSSGTFLQDGTAPYHTFTSVTSSPTALSTQASIWANTEATAEMKVMDGAGNITSISPHNAEGEWVFSSENVLTGKKIYVNMEKFIRRMEEIVGEKFMEESKPSR